MNQEQEENLIDVEKVNQTPYRIKLIYIAILALDIPLESTFIPTTKSELDLVIKYIVEILQKKEEKIRRACSLLEQIDQSQQQDFYYGLVKKYLDNFDKLCSSKVELMIDLPEDKDLNSIALKTLTNLLFYSSNLGEFYLQQQLQCL